MWNNPCNKMAKILMDCNSSKIASYIRYLISVSKKTAHIWVFHPWNTLQWVVLCSGHRKVKSQLSCCGWPPDPTLGGRSAKPECHFSPCVWLTAAVKWCSGVRSALRFEGPLAGVFQPEAHYSHFGVRCACYSMLAITGGAPSQVSDAVVSVVESDLSPAFSLGPGLS